MAPASAPRSERRGDAAPPRDVVLRPVEAEAIELVDVVPSFRPEAPTAEAVLEPGAEVAGELCPGGAGVELVQADGADAAEQVGGESARAVAAGNAQHQVGVVGELVEFAAAADRGAAHAILRPAGAGAHADVAAQPVGTVEARGPAESPIGAAGLIQIGHAREAAEAAAEGDVLSGEGRGGERQAQGHGEQGDGTLQHTVLRPQGVDGAEAPVYDCTIHE